MKIKFLEKYNLIFIIFFLSIVLILAFNLLSLNIHSQDKDSIRKVYYADNITSTHREVIALFNKKHRGDIKVIPINLPFTKFTTNERKELLARSLRSNNSRIDVFAIDQIWGPRFSKWAVNLDEYFSFSVDEVIVPELLFTCYQSNELKSIPLYLDMGLFYFREDMLQENCDYPAIVEKLKKSITWNEFIKLSQENFPGQATFMFQGNNFEGLICNFIEVMGSEEDKITIDKFFEEKAVRTVKFYRDLIYKYQISPIECTQFNEVQSYYYSFQKDVPFFRGWVSSIRDSLGFKEYYSQVDKLGYGSLPHFKGQKPRSVFGGWNLMISNSSDEKEAAATFLKFILSDTVQKIFYQESVYLPVINSLYENKVVDDYLIKIMKNQGVHRPKIKNYTKYSDILSFYINKAIKGEMKAREAIGKARAEIDNYQKELE